eukprot:TCONS_00049365-protein
MDHGEAPQAYTGAYKQAMQKGNAVEIVSELKMECGQMVAIWLIDSKTEPTIGKIIEVEENQVRVNYWKGSWNKKWAPHMLYSNDKRRKMIPWDGWIAKASVILYGFTLINDVLTKSHREYLRKKYKELK